MTHSEIVAFLWGVADLIRDTFKRGKYQDVILPLTVLRRLDCVLAPTKDKVLRRKEELRGRGPQDLDGQLRKALDEAGLLFKVLERFKTVDLHPDGVDNPTMGTIFEEHRVAFGSSLSNDRHVGTR